MSFTLVGWNESQDSSGGLLQVAALGDQHITTQGDDILVPDFAPRLAAVAAISAALTRAQLTSPSLRRHTQLDVAPIVASDEPTAPTPWMNLFDRPLPLEVGEGLRALVSDSTAGASQSKVLAWLLGEATPAPDGPVQTIRCTSTATLTAEAWTLVTLTLSQQLEAGRYAIVGMRAETAGGIAARLVIPGSDLRPGVIAYDAVGDQEHEIFRHGNLGLSWGEFEHLFVPQVEVLATSADTSLVVWLDVVKLP